MQTFLPYASFSKSAKVLDVKRLGKQRVETWQIYKALTETKYGWKNHPAVKMWQGHEQSLLEYGIAVCDEWISRGYNDTMRDRFSQLLTPGVHVTPAWLGDERFHASHRSNLLRKDSVWYSQYDWSEPTSIDYVWPTATLSSV